VLPDFHTDMIIDLAVSPNDNQLIASCDVDGGFYVTDIVKVVADIQGNKRNTQNIYYQCHGTVSSVNWHPTDPFIVTCTEINGSLHLIDIRVNQTSPTVCPIANSV